VDANIDLQVSVVKKNVSDEAFLDVVPLDVPTLPDPGELSVCPYTKLRDVPDSLILLTDMRVVDVADSIVFVKVDQNFAVADWKVSWHVSFSESWNYYVDQ
jgi:hypothetical protein